MALMMSDADDIWSFSRHYAPRSFRRQRRHSLSLRAARMYVRVGF